MEYSWYIQGILMGLPSGKRTACELDSHIKLIGESANYMDHLQFIAMCFAHLYIYIHVYTYKHMYSV